MNDLDKLRKSLDEIDEKMIGLFESRMKISRDVAKVKMQKNLPVFDLKRENQIIDDRLHKINDKTLTNCTLLFVQNLMDISKMEQKKVIENSLPQKESNFKDTCLKVAFQGIKGSYSNEAAQNYFGEGNSLVEFERFEDVVLNVLSENCDYGVLPIENSCAGSVFDVYDLLMKHDVFIVDEYTLHIKHCLLTASNELPKTVFSHEQALAQCSKFIEIKSMKPVEMGNTAIAAKYVKDQGNRQFGAIASEYAAQTYGLNIIRSNISNEINNYTRFIVIAKKLKDKAKFSKIYLSFAVKHQPQSLYNTLYMVKEFNLTKLESRPSGGFKYTFYLDFEGEISKQRLNKLIDELGQSTQNLKLLGAV